MQEENSNWRRNEVGKIDYRRRVMI